MSRPRCLRTVGGPPDFVIFKPAGVPASMLEEVLLTIDEFEALRLADHQGLYHDEAARLMKVSRQTFGRIIQSARKRTATALVEGKAVRIEGGTIEMVERRKFQCDGCGHAWEMPFGTGRPSTCPRCEGNNIHRSEDQRGPLGVKRGRRGGECGRSQLKS